MRKLGFTIDAKTKMQISCAVTAQLISTFVFALQTVQYLSFLNLKFLASSLLRLYSQLLSDLSLKRPVFLQQFSKFVNKVTDVISTVYFTH